MKFGLNNKAYLRNRFISSFAFVLFVSIVQGQSPLVTSGINVYFSNTGNVGIGTTSPAQKLTVQGGGIGFDGNAADKKLFASTDGVLEWFTHDLAAEHGFAVSHQGTKRVFLNTSGNSYLIGGNFGIGTSSPNEMLTVAGNISLTGTKLTLSMTERTVLQMPSVAENNYTRSAYSQNIQWNNVSKKWKITDQTYSDFSLIKMENGGAISFFTKIGNGAIGELTNAQLETYRHMTIGNNGNIGIGTASPGTFKLAVEGKIGARKIIVTEVVNWPDFVFSDSYELMPLEKVKSFIQKHRHLPDVPSAKEVNEKGIDVSENQAMLLQKLEELTLYILQQEEKIKQLTRKVESLEKVNNK